ncbi:MAG: FrgA protein [Myxococcota bacterium]
MPQRLAQHLIARGLLPARIVDEALKRLARDGGSLDTVLLELGAVSEAGVLQAIADVSGQRLVNLADFEPNVEASPLMPFKMARQLNCVPLSLDGNALHVACAYPLPLAQLKDAGFLLGRKLELWVALECRVRDWQAVVYGTPLDYRYAKLLSSLDPSRPKPKPPAAEVGGETESIDAEVLERIARGIVEEPLLLSRPKRPAPKKKKAVIVEPLADDAGDVLLLGEEDEEPRTSVLEPTAYARFARSGHDQDDSHPGVPLDEATSTRVLDIRGYSNFAREVTKQDAPHAPAAPSAPPPPPPRISFPGGVLPPRQPSGELPKVRPAEPEWLQPASAPRPAAARPSPPTRRPPPPAQAPSTPAGQTLPDEADFSDVSADVQAAPVPPARPSAPVPSATPVVPTRPPREARPSSPSPVITAPTPLPVEAAPSAIPTQPAVVAVPRDAAPSTGLETKGRPMREGPPPTPGVQVVPGSAPHLIPESALLPEPTAAQVKEPATAAMPTVAAPPPVPVQPMPDAGTMLPQPPGLQASNAAEWSLAQARASLKTASQNREALVSVILEYGRRAFEYVGAFAVMRGAAVGWDARGDGDVSSIYQVVIPLDAASVFRTVALTRGSYVGPLPPDALSQHYLALLGRAPRTVFLWPVEVQSKLVALVYGDCGARPVSQRRLADFILFCQDLPSAFHELILFRKQNPRAAQHFATPSGGLPEVGAEPGERGDAPTDGDWFSGLLGLLTGPDPSERSMAMLELMKTPDASAYALAQAFPGPTGWSRLPVVELPECDELGPIPGALARLGQSGAAALAPLLDSPDSDTRYLALLTAGSLRYPDVVDGVVRGLFDYEPDISSAARAAAAALRLLPYFQDRLPELRQELASSDPLRRSLAARALGVLHDRASIDALINLTGSEDELCAQSASDALREITRNNFGTDTVAWTGWWARSRDQRRVEWLVGALDSEDFELRLAAIEELSRTFGDNFGFFADGPQAERAGAVSRWRAVVQSRPELEL